MKEFVPSFRKPRYPSSQPRASYERLRHLRYVSNVRYENIEPDVDSYLAVLFYFILRNKQTNKQTTYNGMSSSQGRHAKAAAAVVACSSLSNVTCKE